MCIRDRADAVFLGEKLEPVAVAIDIAVKARNLMQQNLWLAVIYNLIAVPMAIAGGVTPLIAAAAMSGSSVIVTLNALRLRAPKSAALPPAENAEAGPLALSPGRAA